MKNKVLYAGCSFTEGTGYDLLKEEPSLWVNLIHSELFSNLTKVNDGVCGRSNSSIFQDAVRNITNGDFKIAFVEWTSIPRVEFDIGCELYPTSVCMNPIMKFTDRNLNFGTYTSDYLQNVSNRLLCLIHDYGELLRLVDYCNSLIKIANKFETKLFFINGLCPWDEGYFRKLENFEPNQLTNFTQKLLNIHNRSDEEIYKLYNKIHNEYERLGGINSELWLNLYSSMFDLRIDFADNDEHPGRKSNKFYAELFVESLKTKL